MTHGYSRVRLSRYLVEANDDSNAPTSVAVNHTILQDLCADVDGCSVNMFMRNWDGHDVLANAGPYHFSLNPTNHKWSSASTVTAATTTVAMKLPCERGIVIYKTVNIQTVATLEMTDQAFFLC